MTLNIMTQTGKSEVETIEEFECMGITFFIHETNYGAFAVSEKSSGHRIFLAENDCVLSAKTKIEKILESNTVEKFQRLIDGAIKDHGAANE